MTGIKEKNENSWPLVRLITFGSGIIGIDKALRRLEAQAQRLGLIDEIRALNETDLDQGYRDLFGNMPKQHPQGFGLWSWKPYLVFREAQSMKEGDILIYLDAGFEINELGLKRFTEYLDHIANHGFLFFSIAHQHRLWSKPDQELVKKGNFFRNQVAAGAFGLQISADSLSLLRDWLALSSKEEGRLLIGDYEGERLPKGFMGHRHDQSTLSTVVFQHKPKGIIPSEIYFQPWREGKRMPFLAMHNFSGQSHLPIELAKPTIRALRRAARLLRDYRHLNLVMTSFAKSFRIKKSGY
jgi:hypothetical protein